MNVEENLRTTPGKAPRPGSSSSPSTRSSAKKAIKNAKITNFFTKVNSPLNRNSSNSNEPSENEQNIPDDLSKDASSSSMKAPTSGSEGRHKKCSSSKEYVFIIPSSDDDTNVSTKGSQTKRKRPPSVHSNNSESSDGFILTNTNNELGIGRKSRNNHTTDKLDSNSNQEVLTTPTKSSVRDSRSRDSLPSKRQKVVDSAQAVSTNSQHKITRIQPTMIGARTRMIDFKSVPSDLNLPIDQAKSLIKKLFLVTMPDDFFLFWEFAKTINHRKPCSAFSQTYLEWHLAGPFDVLSGLITDFHGFSKSNLLRHCRFYYDSPEFQTVVVKKDEHVTHFGYYRDEPNQDKPIVVMNRSSMSSKLQEVGDNLFTVLKNELESSILALSQSSQEAPLPTFSSSSSKTPRSTKSIESSNKQSQLERAKSKQELTIIRDKLLDFCSTHEDVCPESWSRTNARRVKCFSKTFNTVGIIEGQDKIITNPDCRLTETKLKSMLATISDLNIEDKPLCDSYQELNKIILKSVMTTNGCEPNVCLELGLNLFYQGDVFFHKDIELLLTTAYTQLNRPEFLEILKSHLEERKKSDKVSLLD